MPDKYRLRIQCEIQRLDDHGGYTGDRLSVNDEVTIEVGGFAEVAGVLGQFHELGETIRKARGHAG
jgi:hypothetical protein